MLTRRKLMVAGAAVGAMKLSPARAATECTNAAGSTLSVDATFVDAQRDLAQGLIAAGRDVLSDSSAGRSYSVTRAKDDPQRLRFEVHTGDRILWDVLHAHIVDRCEVAAPERAGRIAYGTPFTWSFSMMIEDGPPIRGDWCVLGQLHHTGTHPTGGGANPPFSFNWHTEGASGLGILARASSTEAATRTYVKPRVVYKDAAFPRGVWVHWVVEFLFAWAGDASLRVWRDGKQVVDRSGPKFALGYEWDSPPRYGVYTRFGIYRASALPGNTWKSPDRNPMAVQYAGFKVEEGRVSC